MAQVIQSLAKNRASLYQMSDREWGVLLSEEASRCRCDRTSAVLSRISAQISRPTTVERKQRYASSLKRRLVLKSVLSKLHVTACIIQRFWRGYR